MITGLDETFETGGTWAYRTESGSSTAAIILAAAYEGSGGFEIDIDALGNVAYAFWYSTTNFNTPQYCLCRFKPIVAPATEATFMLVRGAARWTRDVARVVYLADGTIRMDVRTAVGWHNGTPYPLPVGSEFALIAVGIDATTYTSSTVTMWVDGVQIDSQSGVDLTYSMSYGGVTVVCNLGTYGTVGSANFHAYCDNLQINDTYAPSFTGYRLYMGTGGLSQVDFSTPVSTASAGSSISLADAGLEASSRYTCVLRPVVEDMETPDVSCRIEIETDETGEIVALRPHRPRDVTAEPGPNATMLVSWTCQTPYGDTPPDEFAIYCGQSAETLDGETPVVVSYDKDRRYEQELQLQGGQFYHIGVKARRTTGNSAESFMSNIVGPVMAVSVGPPTPMVLLASVY